MAHGSDLSETGQLCKLHLRKDLRCWPSETLLVFRQLSTEVFDVKKLKWAFELAHGLLNFTEFCLQATGFFDQCRHLLLVLGVGLVAHLDQALTIRSKRSIFFVKLRLEGLNVIVNLACERPATILQL